MSTLIFCALLHIKVCWMYIKYEGSYVVLYVFMIFLKIQKIRILCLLEAYIFCGIKYKHLFFYMLYSYIRRVYGRNFNFGIWVWTDYWFPNWWLINLVRALEAQYQLQIQYFHTLCTCVRRNYSRNSNLDIWVWIEF